MAARRSQAFNVKKRSYLISGENEEEAISEES